MIRLGIDIDDVLYPWFDNAHTWCIKHGLIPEGTPRPRSWAPHEEYRVTSEAWYAALDAATDEGNHLYLGDPIPGTIEALKKAIDHDMDVVLITARGQFKNANRIVGLTKLWVDMHDVPHSELHFTREKGPLARMLGINYAIDDSLPNVLSYGVHQIPCAIQNQTWNDDAGEPESPDELGWRVDHISEFIDQIIENERQV